MLRPFSLLMALVACQVYGGHTEGPMVAFMCNKPAMYLKDGVWRSIDGVDCLTKPQDIFDLCQQMYPDHKINDVVEAGYRVTIPNWCSIERQGDGCTHKHKVMPYKCMEGKFESEALMVPQHCIFDHIYGNECKDYTSWGREARMSCEQRQEPDMVRSSFAILTPCKERKNLSTFRGVEFVCCPKAQQELPHIADEEIEEEEEEDEDEYDDYSSEEEEEDDDEEDDDIDMDDSEMSIDDTDEITADDEDHALLGSDDNDLYNQYLHNYKGQYLNEHDYFLRAKTDLQKNHHEKVTKMMKEWAAAREHVQDMRKADPKAADKLNKEITSRFQKTYEALEQEGMSEKQQLVTLHQQRVQAWLNERKHHAMQHYMEEINRAQPDATRILKALKRYINTEEKDRMHTLNHFKHIRDTDPAAIDAMRKPSLDHLQIVNERIEQSIDMLARVPQFQMKIQEQIEEHLKTFHELDLAVANIIAKTVDVSSEDSDEEDEITSSEDRDPADNEVVETQPITDDMEPELHHVPLEKVAPQLPITDFDDETMEDEKNIPEIIEDKPKHIAHAHNNEFEIQAKEYHPGANEANLQAGSALAIAVASITVFAIIVVGIVVLRRRTQPTNSDGGFVQVDQAASPEEKHVANMQINGYENPTYRYFEMSTDNA